MYITCRNERQSGKSARGDITLTANKSYSVVTASTESAYYFPMTVNRAYYEETRGAQDQHPTVITNVAYHVREERANGTTVGADEPYYSFIPT